MEKDKVYAFVGVVGGGKTFRLEKMLNDAEILGISVIKADFSDGVRDTLMNILTGSDQEIDLSSKLYADWKLANIDVPVPYETFHCNTIRTTGRELLQNTAEFCKKLAGAGVWAKYAEDKVVSRFKEYVKSGTFSSDNISIMFGSVRFPSEVQAVFRVGEKTGKDVQFIFCDYHSENYSPNIEHISEGLAHDCISAGFKDGDDITEYLYDRYCC